MALTKEQLQERLTDTDTFILQWLANGKTHSDIAALLKINRNVVDQRTHRIRNLLGAGTSCGAVVIALRAGLIF